MGLGVLACSSSSVTGDDGLTNAAGTPGQVVYVTTSFAGGQRLVDSLMIDSASGRWSQSQCGPVSATAAPCDEDSFQTVTGTMESFLRVPLFERARRSDFQSLQRDYRRGGVTPPDGMTHQLQVVQNGRRRTVSWESGATIPPTVETFLCWLQAARGALILCAE
jgi:hypothetical protein